MEPSITKKEIVLQTVPILSKTLENRGFRYIKKREEFIKKTDFGYISYSVGIKGFWPLHQEIRVAIQFRYDIIANIYYLFHNERFMNMEFAKTNSTLIFLLQIHDNMDVVEISNEAQLRTILDKIPYMINREGIMLEEKYSDLNNVCQYFKNEYLTELYLPFQSYIEILISMKVVNDSDYEKYRDEIYKKVTDSPYIEPEGKDAVYECISYLDKLST